MARGDAAAHSCEHVAPRSMGVHERYAAASSTNDGSPSRPELYNRHTGGLMPAGDDFPLQRYLAISACRLSKRTGGLSRSFLRNLGDLELDQENPAGQMRQAIALDMVRLNGRT